MTTKPHFWIQSLTEALEDAKEIPLWGTPPPFPWEKLEHSLKDKFSLKNLKITCGDTTWKKDDQLTCGMGATPFLVPFSLSSIEGSFFWAMAKEDAEHLSAGLLTTSQTEKGFSDDRFTTGFLRYLSLEVLETLSELNPFGGLTLNLAEETAQPSGTALCVDIQASLFGKAINGRLLFPPDFHHSYKKHFSVRKPDITSKELASSVSTALHLEVGSVTLSFDEWSSLKEGDFVVLDRCGYHPDEEKGTLELVLGNTPLFQARLKNHTLKILEYSFYYEEEGDMDASDDPQNPMEEPLEDIPEEEMEGEEETPEHLWSKETSGAPLENMLAANEVPVSLTVEVGRLQMSLEKLLELEPGNTLELTTRIEDGVTLTTNGKRVAKGELVQLGNILGIKILKLGK